MLNEYGEINSSRFGGMGHSGGMPGTQDSYHGGSNVAKLEIIFKDSESSVKTNKELINYFKNNINSFNREKIQLVLRMVSKDEQKLCMKRGIKNLPALIIPNGNIKYGTKEIVNGIGTFISERKKFTGDIVQLANGMCDISDEAIHEFQKKMIGKAGDDNPDVGNDVPDFRAKEMDMMRRRKSAGMHSNFNSEFDNIGRQDNSFSNISPLNATPQDSLMRMQQMGTIGSVDADMMQAQLDKIGGSSLSMDYF